MSIIDETNTQQCVTFFAELRKKIEERNSAIRSIRGLVEALIRSSVYSTIFNASEQAYIAAIIAQCDAVDSISAEL